MAFKHADFYRFDELLGEEERMIRDTLRSFFRQEDVKNVLRRCNSEAKPVPMELIRELAGLGVVGANIPDENGERTTNLGYGIINREFEAADSALRSFISVQSGLVMYPIWRFGSDEQKARWLAPLRTAQAVGCFGLTEDYGGSNPAGMRTIAQESDDGYVLNGSKNWITNAPGADIAVIWARAKNGIRAFLVEKGTPGYETHPIKDKGSLRASQSGSIALQDCKIPKTHMLPAAAGMPAVYACLNKARYGIAWGTSGMVRTCYEKILELTQNRAPFGVPLASRQLVQEDLAIIDADLVDILARTFRLAGLADACDQGNIDERELGSQISQAKWRCIELAIDAVDRCLELSGADGLTYEYPFWAAAANLRTLRTYEGTKKIHMLIQGRRITGKEAF